MCREPGLVCKRFVYLLTLLLLVILLARSEPAIASTQDSTPPGAPAAAKQGPEDEVIVKFRRGTPAAETTAAHTQNSGAVSRTIPQTGAQVVKVPAGQATSRAAAYARLPQVEYAEVNGIYPMIGMTTDPMVSQQWQYNNTGQAGGTPGADIDAFEAWDITMGSASVAVAILDTGIDKTHVDLASKVTKRVNFSTSSTDDDQVGHGTHVAGTVAASTNNATGVAGTCPQCTLYSVKVLDDSGNGTFADVATGIIWAADNGARVINMSLGDTAPSSTVEDAINYAWSHGVVIVAGAGNNGNTTLFYPAAYANVISVAATDSADAKASFSTFGSWVDVAAPGSNILSTAPDHFNSLWLFPVNYATASGTSMASPHVAGIAGLVWSTGLCSTNTCVRQRIEGRTDAIAGTGSTWIYGRVNARSSVVAGSPTPKPPSIYAIVPATGAFAGGTLVTITGAGFVPGGTSVKFGNAAATTASCASATTCTAASPAGTGTAFVTVTTAAGTSSISAAAQFTYVPPPCTSVNVTTSVASPQTPGVAVAFTATAAGCTTPEYRFLLLPPGGGWQVVREWGTGIWTWNTAGIGLGSYTISVWARSVGSAASWETAKETPFTLQPPPPPSPCTSVNVTTGLASPQQPGVSVPFTATAVGCTTPEYRFWILAPGGNWQMVRDYGPGAWTWNTAGSLPGSYTISVWARAVGSTASWETAKETPFTLQAPAPPPPPPPCTSVNVTTGVASPQMPGVAVSFTATAAGCTTPEYRYWVLAPGGNWQIVRDWGVASWTWNTAGSAAGNYTISVWARAVGSTASWETAKETPFTLSSPPPPPPCTSVNVTASVASPQQPGVAVPFTATAAGCTAPEYRFWIQAPGGNWQMVRDYGTGAWTWNTAGSVPGTYTISVWARAVGSTASWETAKETPFSLSSPPSCTSVNVTTSVPSPQTPGVPVTFTATAVGCATPEYRFWILPPGGNWQMVRDYGTSAWSWNTAGNVPGSYTISVWARAIGSTASWETAKETPFTLQ